MNISFAKLGHEECEVCMKNEEHKKEVGENEHDCADCKKHIEHIQRDKLCRGCYKEDKKAQDDGSNDTLYVSLDLQKVRMLPEIPGVKTAVFTQRICAYNESFVPIGKGEGLIPPHAFIWHQGIAGRMDEDITSCFVSFINNMNRDVRHLVIWTDNCTAQSKN